MTLRLGSGRVPLEEAAQRYVLHDDAFAQHLSL